MINIGINFIITAGNRLDTLLIADREVRKRSPPRTEGSCSESEWVHLAIPVYRQLALFSLQPPLGIPPVKEQAEFPLCGLSRVRAVEAISGVAESVPRTEALRIFPLGLVRFRCAEHAPPTFDRIGTVERERHRGARDHTEDQTVVVEASLVFCIEGMCVG